MVGKIDMSDAVENIYEALQDEAYARLFFRDQPLADFGDAVLLERLGQGLSQQDLATSAEMRQAVISEVENAVGNPTFRTMQRIAEALGCVLHIEMMPLREYVDTHYAPQVQDEWKATSAEKVIDYVVEPLLRETGDAYDVDDVSAENESIL
jgi:transcriptional regulator with XRE-family HTH domain